MMEEDLAERVHQENSRTMSSSRETSWDVFIKGDREVFKGNFMKGVLAVRIQGDWEVSEGEFVKGSSPRTNSSRKNFRRTTSSRKTGNSRRTN